MEHRIEPIEPEESWLLVPWSRKKTYEKFGIILGIVVGAWQSVELYESGSVVDWFWMSLCWFLLGYAYFSQPKSREVIVVNELELSSSRSVQAERHLPT